MSFDHAAWSCVSTSPGFATDPSKLAALGGDWLPATVPGTATAALREAGRWRWGRDDEPVLDGRDWWWRCRFERLAEEGPWDLRFGGLATLADVWLNGEHLLHSENMFISHRLPISELAERNELTIRCAALLPALSRRHPRPRFKSRLVRHQSLRWYRTTLLGRMPGWSRWAAPIGPWRPVTLSPRPARGALVDLELAANCDGRGGGIVSMTARLADGLVTPSEAWLRVGEHQRVAVALDRTADGVRLSSSVRLPRIQRWWPHTHGEQPLYDVVLEFDGELLAAGRVGFREVELDDADGGFTPIINGERCFCRGVTWGPTDAVSLVTSAEDLRRTLELVRDAGINMIRLGGFGIYEDHRFWDLCDALGIMVWQDCMIASVDPPDDGSFLAQLERELREQFGALRGRPALTVACGSSETYQQGSMYGLEPERYRSELLERWIPTVLEPLIDVPYVPSSPSGGDPPIRPDVGVAHYFGVGAYLRPLSDARLAGVRFAAECLSFANPPERQSMEREFGGAAAVGHDARWQAAVAHDAGTPWDFEDVREHYVKALFGVDPLQVRYDDPEHALDLGRAAIVEVMQRVLGDWRDRESGCAGAIVLAWSDLWPGAGWGVVDAFGVPKASYYALARTFAPRMIRLRDLGLSGLMIDIFNDLPMPLTASVQVRIRNSAGGIVEEAEREIAVGGRSQLTIEASQLLGGFRDLTGAYRFRPQSLDVVTARLVAADGAVLGCWHHLPAGCARPREANVGLHAKAVLEAPGRWALEVGAERFAQFVSIEAAGLIPSDAWFHVAAGDTVRVGLTGDAKAPTGTVRALNAVTTARISVPVAA